MGERHSSFDIGARLTGEAPGKVQAGSSPPALSTHQTRTRVRAVVCKSKLLRSSRAETITRGVPGGTEVTACVDSHRERERACVRAHIRPRLL